MSEEKKQKKPPKPMNEALFRAVCWVALHQRVSNLLCVALAVLCVSAVFFFVPGAWWNYVMIGLAVLILLLYRAVSKAPAQAVREWRRRWMAVEKFGAEGPEKLLEVSKEAYAYFLQLEQALPVLAKKELNVYLTYWKAVFLHTLGRKEEALSLLRGFDQFWDEGFRADFQRLIDKLSEAEGKDTPKEI